MAENSDIFDLYTDIFNVSINPYGVNLAFQKSPAIGGPNAGQPSMEGVVRMSHAHAKVMAMLLRRHLKRFEEEVNISIAVPFKVMNDLGLSNEDW